MLCAAFMVFLAGLIYFRQELLLCFGLKGSACWLGSFIGGYVLISLVWPPGTIGWSTFVPILFLLIAKVRFNRLYSPGSICSHQMWELEKAAREHAAEQAFEESRTVVPKHIEHDEPKANNKNETP